MTQVRERRGRGDHDPRSASSRNAYLAALRIPGALAFSSAGFVGRMSMSMYGLGTVLLIALLTGRYGQAGTVAAVGSVGYAVLSPIIATRADRLGQRPVLLMQTAVFALGSAVFISCAELKAPFWALLVTGLVSGATMPSVGSMVRARWSMLADGDPGLLHTAFALESVNDEFIFVIGPALVTLLATQLFPASGIGAACLLCVVGTSVFAAQRRTEPRVSPRPRPAARTPVTLPSLPAAGLVTLAPAFLLLGAMFASIDLSTVAFASELGHRPLAGLIIATIAFGSAVGGLCYGSRHWRAPLGRRFVIAAAMSVAGVSTFWAAPGLLVLAVLGFTAGLAISPMLMTGYSILERQAPPHRRTEAMAWLGSTISVGVALGSAFSGHIVDARGARWSFAFAASCGVGGVLTCLIGRGRLRTHAGAQPAELGAATMAAGSAEISADPGAPGTTAIEPGPEDLRDD